MASGNLSDARLDVLIDTAYASIEDEARWNEFLLSLSDSFKGTGAASLQHDLVRQGAVLSSVRIDPGQLKLYQEYYHTVDPWATGGVARRLATPGRVVVDEALISRSDFEKTEFFAYVEPQGLSRLIYATLERSDRAFVNLCVYRASRGKPFGQVEVGFLEALLPHVTRAMQVLARLRDLRGQAVAARRGLESLPCAALLVQGDGRVVAANQRAWDYIERGRWLRIAEGRVAADGEPATRTLLNLIAAHANSVTCRRTPKVPDAVLRLWHADSDKPHDLRVIPMSGSEPFGVAVDRRCALLLLSDADEGLLPDPDFLRTHFRMTATEASVAVMLASGASSDEVARKRKCTIETARWHCKHVLQKLGCHTRAEVAALLSTPWLIAQHKDRPT